MLKELYGKDDRVQKAVADQLEQMLFSAPFSATVTLLTGMLIEAPVFWWRSDDVPLTTAAVIAIILNAFRIAVVYFFNLRNRDGDCAHSTAYWVLLYAVGGCFSINMAALVARAFFLGDVGLIALAAMAGSGYIVGLIFRASAVPRLAVPHLLLLFVPLIALAVCVPDRIYLFIALVLALFCVGCVGLSLNIYQRTKAQLTAEQRLSVLARTDYLTGLANRANFDAHGATLLRRAKTQRVSFAVALIDLDGFKAVNDTHGHAAGDDLLKEVSARIQAVLKSEHFAARFGGDEFAIVFDLNTKLDDATSLGHHILRSLERPFKIGGTKLQISGSVGLAAMERPSGTFASIVETADNALYQAKDAGKNGLQVLVGPEMAPSIAFAEIGAAA